MRAIQISLGMMLFLLCSVAVAESNTSRISLHGISLGDTRAKAEAALATQGLVFEGSTNKGSSFYGRKDSGPGGVLVEYDSEGLVSSVKGGELSVGDDSYLITTPGYRLPVEVLVSRLGLPDRIQPINSYAVYYLYPAQHLQVTVSRHLDEEIVTGFLTSVRIQP